MGNNGQWTAKSIRNIASPADKLKHFRLEPKPTCQHRVVSRCCVSEHVGSAALVIWRLLRGGCSLLRKCHGRIIHVARIRRLGRDKNQYKLQIKYFQILTQIVPALCCRGGCVQKNWLSANNNGNENGHIFIDHDWAVVGWTPVLALTIVLSISSLQKLRTRTTPEISAVASDTTLVWS